MMERERSEELHKRVKEQQREMERLRKERDGSSIGDSLRSTKSSSSVRTKKAISEDSGRIRGKDSRHEATGPEMELEAMRKRAEAAEAALKLERAKVDRLKALLASCQRYDAVLPFPPHTRYILKLTHYFLPFLSYLGLLLTSW